MESHLHSAQRRRSPRKLSTVTKSQVSWPPRQTSPRYSTLLCTDALEPRGPLCFRRGSSLRMAFVSCKCGPMAGACHRPGTSGRRPHSPLDCRRDAVQGHDCSPPGSIGDGTWRHTRRSAFRKRFETSLSEIRFWQIERDLGEFKL